MRALYIIGAGGFGRETAWLAERMNQAAPTWEIKGFIDDNEKLWGQTVNGYKVLGGDDYLKNKEEEIWAAAAVGNAEVRKKIIERISGFAHIHFATLIDPGVEMSGLVSVGEGSIICTGTIITVNVNIGRHNIINLDCTIGHDAVLEDFVTLYPSVNVSGAVRIGGVTELGTGTQIIQGVKIAGGSVTGAGAVVVADLTEPGTYVGVPVRKKP